MAIGNFDGVHRGHQALLSRLKACARAQGLPAIVMIFEPQPLEFFAKGSAPPRLSRLREKYHLLADLAVDKVLVIEFNGLLAGLAARDFIKQILINQLSVKHVIVGADFHFGRGREGNSAFLEKTGQQEGFAVEVMPSVMDLNERISSTRIRQALANGDHVLAELLLGRPYFMMGRVVYGNQLGRTLGYPTANIHLHRMTCALSGIYAVRLYGANNEGFPGVAYVGTRPTLSGTRVILEVHLFNFAKDLYGQYVKVEFYRKLRDDERFDSLDQLKEQIAKDVKQAKVYFGLEC